MELDMNAIFSSSKMSLGTALVNLACLLLSLAALILFRVNHANIAQTTERHKMPNFLFILADDLGWNDVGYHNPSVKTPNIDKLATEGLKLEKMYTLPLCTPSRAALMTGRYPFKIGMQHRVLAPGDPASLPLNLTLLPQLLKKQGYTTHITGKWHLGECTFDAFPTRRGFDSFVGFVGGAIDQFTRQSVEVRGQNKTYYDFWRGTDLLRIDDNQVFTEDLLVEESMRVMREAACSNKPFFLYHSSGLPHVPLTVPTRYVDLYPTDVEPIRRKYLGMVSALDDSVGRLIAELDRLGLRKDTIIVFQSDNGGVANTFSGPFKVYTGNNFPLRSTKGSLYDGGVRVPAFVNSPLLRGSQGRTSKSLFHITDWFPTLLSLAGAHDQVELTDGKDQSPLLRNSQQQPIRKNAVIQILDILFGGLPDHSNSSIAYIEGHHKLILGPAIPAYPAEKARFTPGSEYNQPDEWRVENRQRPNIDSPSTCGHNFYDVCLYDLEADPSETRNIAADDYQRVEHMTSRVRRYLDDITPPVNAVPLFSVPDEVYTDVNGNLKPGWCDSDAAEINQSE